MRNHDISTVDTMVNSEIMSELANREVEAESRHRRDSEDEQLLVPMEMELPDRPYVDFTT